MDTESIVTRLAFAVILAVLSFYVYKWWLGTKSQYVAAEQDLPSPPAQDPPPTTPGVTMYGSDTCPWCVKQKDYFRDNGTEYTFVDCSKGQCPNFVSGFPTLVVNGEIKVGYQEI